MIIITEPLVVGYIFFLSPNRFFFVLFFIIYFLCWILFRCSLLFAWAALAQFSDINWISLASGPREPLFGWALNYVSIDSSQTINFSLSRICFFFASAIHSFSTSQNIFQRFGGFFFLFVFRPLLFSFWMGILCLMKGKLIYYGPARHGKDVVQLELSEGTKNERKKYKTKQNKTDWHSVLGKLGNLSPFLWAHKKFFFFCVVCLVTMNGFVV